MSDTLKNLIKSIDPAKLWQADDRRNAIIGSALGGLVLGGKSMMAKRDPEESKLEPVGDALLGAVLGGAAGYGIPKGLQLFSDAGSIATDTIKNHPVLSALKGGTIGAGLGLSSALPAIMRAKGRLLSGAEDMFAKNRELFFDDFLTARDSLRQLVERGANAREIASARANLLRAKAALSAYTDVDYAAVPKFKDFKEILRQALDREYGTTGRNGLVRAARRVAGRFGAGTTEKTRRIQEALKTLAKERKVGDRGYAKPMDVVRAINEGASADLPQTKSRIGRIWRWATGDKNLSEKMIRRGVVHGPGRRILNRAGALAGLGAGIGTAWDKFIGPAVNDYIESRE